mmetsp:Transcript_17474/g.24252  ORF Transcript_17474/g.24252 Transcript_17474/m.24252 type:complete len:134 (+) Transcript_17474:40-441(+)
MDWVRKYLDTRPLKVQYKFDPSLSDSDKQHLRHVGLEWAKLQCEAKRQAFHDCQNQNVWTAVYRCLDAQQDVQMCIQEKLTPEAIRSLEQDFIRKREEKKEAQKLETRDKELDRQFVEFAHKFREHKEESKNQ